MKKRLMENWEKYGMDYAPKQNKALRTERMRWSKLSSLEIVIERELSERNLPESDDFGWSD